jgi:Flp pilus assembly protein TadD
MEAAERYGEPMASRQRKVKVGAPLCALTARAWSCGLTATSQTRADNSFDALLRRGFELHRQAQFSEAIPVLERARKLQPGDYFTNLLLGIDLLRSGKAKESVPYVLMRLKGDAAGAQSEYREGIAVRPNDPNLFHQPQ